MAQEFWYPPSATRHDIPAGYNDGTGDNSTAQPGGGRAGPMTHDDASTYVLLNTNEVNIEHAVNISWPGPIAGYTNSAGALTAGCRHAKVSGVALDAVRSAYFLNATPTEGSAFMGVTDQATWATTGPIDVTGATYRPGGGTWVVTDFDDETTIFAGFREGNAPTGFVGAGFTSVWGQLTYSPAGGGFVFMLGLAGLSALPFVGRMTDFTAFRKFLDWREVYHPRHTKWDGPEEVLTAWRDIQAYRWPTQFDLAGATA